MIEYKDLKTGSSVTASDEKRFIFPNTGAKILVKLRPSVAKEINVD